MSFEDTLRSIVREEVRAAVDELRQAIALPASPAPTLLTVADVARSCQASAKTVVAWISSGRLPARKAGRKWLVQPADLDRFLAGSAASSPASDDAAAVVRILSKRRA